MQDMEGIQAMVGICPQCNLHFETLTVKENLRLFAHIKGIQWKETEQEVGMCFLVADLCPTAFGQFGELYFRLSPVSCSAEMRVSLI